MTNTRTERVLLAIAMIVAIVGIVLMTSLPADLLKVNPVYQGF